MGRLSRLLFVVTIISFSTLFLVTSHSFAAKEIVLRMAGTWTDTDGRVPMIKDFIRTVNERTNGVVEIQWYPGGALVPDKDMKSAIPKGIVDLAQCNLGMWTGVVPEFAVMTLLTFFEDSDHCWRALGGQLGDILQKVFEEKAQTKIIAWLETAPPDAVVGVKGLIKKPEDLAGLKMRVPNRGFGIALETLKGSPVLMSSGELYLSLQKGVIDGIFSTSGRAAPGLKLYEVAKNWTRINLLPGVNFGLVMNLKRWKKLPPDIQKVISEAGDEVRDRMRETTKRSTDKIWSDIAKLPGVNVYAVPEQEVSEWSEKILPDQIKSLSAILPESKANMLLDLSRKARAQ